MGPRLRALWFTALLASGCDPSAFDPRAWPDAGRASDAEPFPQTDAALARDADIDATSGASDLDAGSPDAGDASGSADAGDATGPVDPCVRADQRLAVTKPAVELARLATSPLFESRTLGPTIRLGDSDHVWTFSGTRRVDSVPAASAAPANHPYVAFDGKFQPWNAASTAKPAAWSLREPASDAGTALPPTLLPLRSGEGNLVSLVPSSFVRLPDEPRGLLFITHYDTLTQSKVWLARLEDGATQATRATTPLFSAGPLFALAARVDGEYVILYACTPANGTNPTRCVAGRVPTAMVDQADAYQVRTTNAAGAGSWSSDLSSGTTVLENVNNDLTISYNGYLRRYVAVYGEPSSNQVLLRTAAQPYGPWSEPVRVALPAPSALNNGGIREHPSLAQNCERRLVISYFAPTRAEGFFPLVGDAVLAAIDLD